jgi:hypothetical protein
MAELIQRSMRAGLMLTLLAAPAWATLMESCVQSVETIDPVTHESDFQSFACDSAHASYGYVFAYAEGAYGPGGLNYWSRYAASSFQQSVTILGRPFGSRGYITLEVMAQYPYYGTLSYEVTGGGVSAWESGYSFTYGQTFDIAAEVSVGVVDGQSAGSVWFRSMTVYDGTGNLVATFGPEGDDISGTFMKQSPAAMYWVGQAASFANPVATPEPGSAALAVIAIAGFVLRKLSRLRFRVHADGQIPAANMRATRLPSNRKTHQAMD